eukprot:TRINITY_DN1711_c1_g2_i2.p1 TRINITY_DN1711_c1_g2~~TRINITY_DN1711_c1_g2_i2.p1  ORF type:complete len:528 (-),score=65.89 TRINITY_DN1711_c1_g2_i2:470-2053(-)
MSLALQSSCILKNRISSKQQKCNTVFKKLQTKIRKTTRICIRSEATSGEKIRDPRKLLKREIELKSNKIDQNVRKAVEDAVEECGYAVSVGEVAGKSGISVNETEDTLKALVADTDGSLRVSSEGEVQYVLNSSFRSTLRNKSILIKLEPVAQFLQEAGAYLIRVSFGTALLASIAIAWTALIVIASSGSDRENNRRNEGSSGGFNMGYMPMRFGMDWFWYWDPYYYYRYNPSISDEDPEKMGFFQAIFSVVFGDGDPNLTLENERWQILGNFIKSKGGVVTAEQMAPFLDTPESFLQNRQEAFRDESFVVPALLRFGGKPEIDDAGNILYMFPSLMVDWGQNQGRQQWWQGLGQRRPRDQLIEVPGTEAQDRSQALVPQGSMLVEQEWEQTRTTLVQKFGVGLLLGLNALGIGLLSYYTRNPQIIRVLSLNGFAWLPSFLPVLQGYAVSLFAIPLFRWFRNKQRNQQIRLRNKSRYDSYWLLSRPDQDLKNKILSAEKQSKKQKLRAGEIVYTTEKDMLEQPDPIS